MTTGERQKEVPGSKSVPYYTPEQTTRAGTALVPQPDDAAIPKLFSPLKIKNVELQNRIGVSPMCTYSAGYDGVPTPWHLVHLGQFLLRGPSITFTEASSVSDIGGLSPHDLGIWNDEQAKGFKPIVDFAHSQNQLIGIQLAHSGRKASTVPPYVHIEDSAPESAGGWPLKIVGPSAIKFRPQGYLPVPHELTVAEIKQIVNQFRLAAQRALDIAGFDIIEIHAAHGYLLNEFLSEVSNKRTDEYGGSFENRIRIVLEIIETVRSVTKDKIPLWLRISASENNDEDPLAWRIEDLIKLAKIVRDQGIDVLDVSSGGNSYQQTKRPKGFGQHVPLARAIKEALGDSLLLAVPGNLNDSAEVRDLLEEGVFDIALVGRGFLRNPGLIWTWADELGVKLQQSLQYHYPFALPKDQLEWLIETSK